MKADRSQNFMLLRSLEIHRSGGAEALLRMARERTRAAQHEAANERIVEFAREAAVALARGVVGHKLRWALKRFDETAPNTQTEEKP